MFGIYLIIGNDIGTQYASVIYVHDEVQMEIAKKVRDDLQAILLRPSSWQIYQNKYVTTDILPLTSFYVAEESHQEYLTRNPGGYCNHYIRSIDWSNVK